LITHPPSSILSQTPETGFIDKKPPILRESVARNPVFDIGAISELSKASNLTLAVRAGCLHAQYNSDAIGFDWDLRMGVQKPGLMDENMALQPKESRFFGKTRFLLGRCL
jgi:hypothetical protein